MPPKRLPRKRTPRKRTPRRHQNTLQRKSAKQIAERISSDIPDELNEMQVSSGGSTCALTPEGLTCTERNMDVNCVRDGNRIICTVNGVTHTCYPDKKTGKMKCRFVKV